MYGLHRSNYKDGPVLRGWQGVQCRAELAEERLAALARDEVHLSLSDDKTLPHLCKLYEENSTVEGAIKIKV